MKKVIIKSALAVVVMATSCLGVWRAYGAYGNVDNSLLMENLEALSADSEGESGDNGEGKPAILENCKSPGGGKKGTVMYICTEGTTLFYSNSVPPQPKMSPCSTRGIPDISLFSMAPNNGYCMRY